MLEAGTLAGWRAMMNHGLLLRWTIAVGQLVIMNRHPSAVSQLLCLTELLGVQE